MRRAAPGPPLAASQMRVAVVTTSLRPEANELWAAASGLVGDMRLFGAAAPVGGPVEQRVPSVQLSERFASRGLIWRHLTGLRRRLREYEPDLVHVNGELWSLTAQECLSTQHRLVVHGAENLWQHGRRGERFARDILVRRAIEGISGYVSWNGDGARHVEEISTWPIPTVTLPAIIPPQTFRDRRWEGPPIDDGSEFRILLVGRLVPVKGFGTVIDAVAGLSSRGRVRITVCGEGPDEGHLRAMAASTGVQINFLGSVSEFTLADLMTRAHCLVQPSVTQPDVAEQFGRSVAEAMTVGLPCLVSSSGELPAVVGHDSSAIFAEGDETELLRLLEAYVRQPRRLVELSARQAPLASLYAPGEAAARIADFWTGAFRARQERSQAH